MLHLLLPRADSHKSGRSSIVRAVYLALLASSAIAAYQPRGEAGRGPPSPVLRTTGALAGRPYDVVGPDAPPYGTSAYEASIIGIGMPQTYSLPDSVLADMQPWVNEYCRNCVFRMFYTGVVEQVYIHEWEDKYVPALMLMYSPTIADHVARGQLRPLTAVFQRISQRTGIDPVIDMPNQAHYHEVINQVHYAIPSSLQVLTLRANTTTFLKEGLYTPPPSNPDHWGTRGWTFEALVNMTNRFFFETRIREPLIYESCMITPLINSIALSRGVHLLDERGGFGWLSEKFFESPGPGKLSAAEIIFELLYGKTDMMARWVELNHPLTREYLRKRLRGERWNPKDPFLMVRGTCGSAPYAEALTCLFRRISPPAPEMVSVHSPDTMVHLNGWYYGLPSRHRNLTQVAMAESFLEWFMTFRGNPSRLNHQLGKKTLPLYNNGKQLPVIQEMARDQRALDTFITMGVNSSQAQEISLRKFDFSSEEYEKSRPPQYPAYSQPGSNDLENYNIVPILLMEAMWLQGLQDGFLNVSTLLDYDELIPYEGMNKYPMTEEELTLILQTKPSPAKVKAAFKRALEEIAPASNYIHLPLCSPGKAHIFCNSSLASTIAARDPTSMEAHILATDCKRETNDLAWVTNYTCNLGRASQYAMWDPKKADITCRLSSYSEMTLAEMVTTRSIPCPAECPLGTEWNDDTLNCEIRLLREGDLLVSALGRGGGTGTGSGSELSWFFMYFVVGIMWSFLLLLLTAITLQLKLDSYFFQIGNTKNKSWRCCFRRSEKVTPISTAQKTEQDSGAKQGRERNFLTQLEILHGRSYFKFRASLAISWMLCIWMLCSAAAHNVGFQARNSEHIMGEVTVAALSHESLWSLFAISMVFSGLFFLSEAHPSNALHELSIRRNKERLEERAKRRATISSLSSTTGISSGTSVYQHWKGSSKNSMRYLEDAAIDTKPVIIDVAETYHTSPSLMSKYSWAWLCLLSGLSLVIASAPLLSLVGNCTLPVDIELDLRFFPLLFLGNFISLGGMFHLLIWTRPSWKQYSMVIVLPTIILANVICVNATTNFIYTPEREVSECEALGYSTFLIVCLLLSVVALGGSLLLQKKTSTENDDLSQEHINHQRELLEREQKRRKVLEQERSDLELDLNLTTMAPMMDLLLQVGSKHTLPSEGKTASQEKRALLPEVAYRCMADGVTSAQMRSLPLLTPKAATLFRERDTPSERLRILLQHPPFHAFFTGLCKVTHSEENSAYLIAVHYHLPRITHREWRLRYIELIRQTWVTKNAPGYLNMDGPFMTALDKEMRVDPLKEGLLHELTKMVENLVMTNILNKVTVPPMDYTAPSGEENAMLRMWYYISSFTGVSKFKDPLKMLPPPGNLLEVPGTPQHSPGIDSDRVHSIQILPIQTSP